MGSSVLRTMAENFLKLVANISFAKLGRQIFILVKNIDFIALLKRNSKLFQILDDRDIFTVPLS
jgi:hypothetical protein